jgi:hypothetical protein
MSREEKVCLVEAYLDCFATKDLSKVSFAEDVTFEGPRMPKLAGRATVLGFLAHILPMVISRFMRSITRSRRPRDKHSRRTHV